MTKRDSNKTARNKRIKEITEELNIIIDEVLERTGYKSQQSLNAKIGGKHAVFYDVRHEVIHSSSQYRALWMEGLMRYLDELRNKENSNNYELLINMQEHRIIMEYVTLFLERSYYKHYDELCKVRPRPEEAIIWIGQENANYGLLVTPTFRKGQWINDGSEIRKFKQDYFTIGHVIETGLVIPGVEEKMLFNDIDSYLNFFKNVVVRNSGSEYEREIAKLYCEYVKQQNEPLNIPLLIPEFRYNGLEKKHKYRLDFTIINPYTLNKFGFELSPWSSHGYLKGTAAKTQKKINQEALENFEKEMRKHKDYYRKHGVYSFFYTDSDLADIKSVFEDMSKYLNPKKSEKQLEIHILGKFSDYQ